jgi:hypothetical protein
MFIFNGRLILSSNAGQQPQGGAPGPGCVGVRRFGVGEQHIRGRCRWTSAVSSRDNIEINNV